MASVYRLSGSAWRDESDGFRCPVQKYTVVFVLLLNRLYAVCLRCGGVSV